LVHAFQGWASSWIPSSLRGWLILRTNQKIRSGFNH
jgi:hypothetical protein